MKYAFKTKPYDHQLRALRRALKSDHIGLLWEPRTGKSKTIIDLACALYLQKRIQRVLIVCPLSVIGVWEDEWRTHAPLQYHLIILDKRDLQIDTCRRLHLHILVSNYDLVWRRKEIVAYWNPQMVVADESHLAKKPSSRRAKWLRSYSKAKYRAILTGTVAPKGWRDLYAQWVFLNRRTFGGNVGRFDERYVRRGGFKGFQIQGYRHISELKAKVDKDAMIVRRDDVFDRIPTTTNRVPVFLEDDAWNAYQKMAYELFLELKGGDISDAKNVAVKIMRLQQITGGWIRSDEGNLHQLSTAKIAATKERLEDLWHDNERVVVFARFIPEVEAIAGLGGGAGLPTYVLRGGVGRDERSRLRKQFQARPGPSLFLAQIQAGGLGIPLHKAHEVIFYSVTYSLADYIQAADRVQGPEQAQDVRYQHIVARSTIDLDVYASLKAKRNILDLIMAKPKEFAARLARQIGIDEE